MVPGNQTWSVVVLDLVAPAFSDTILKLFLIWTVSGICYGMVELIRRVIPADIVGGHVDKLRRMDATVVSTVTCPLEG
jgi:hypothetical protein